MNIIYLPKIIKVETLIDVTNNIADEHAFASIFSEFLKDNRWKSIDGKVTLLGMETVADLKETIETLNKEEEDVKQ